MPAHVVQAIAVERRVTPLDRWAALCFECATVVAADGERPDMLNAAYLHNVEKHDGAGVPDVRPQDIIESARQAVTIASRAARSQSRYQWFNFALVYVNLALVLTIERGPFNIFGSVALGIALMSATSCARRAGWWSARAEQRRDELADVERELGDTLDDD